MIRSLRLFLILLFLAGGNLPAAELKVSAAASLSESLVEISGLYQRSNGEKLELNFGGSNALARQIQAGAPCDVFFSADEASLNQLLSADLVHQNSVTRLLGNSLVIIVPSDSSLKITAAADLASTAIRRLALGDPAAVPAGVYARQWLEAQKAWKSVSAKIVATENVRGALAAVASGNAEAGVVYRTDAMTTKEVKIAFEVPDTEAPAIVYPVAATKSSADPGKAIRFIAFLKQEKAAAIFRKHGFIPLPPAAGK